MRDPLISVSNQVPYTECCSSCHTFGDLIEARIGNTIHIICRSCLDKLNKMANGRRDAAALEQARASEASYKRLYKDLLTMTNAGEKHLTVCALSALWKLLGVSNQTEAVLRIKKLYSQENLV